MHYNLGFLSFSLFVVIFTFFKRKQYIYFYFIFYTKSLGNKVECSQQQYLANTIIMSF